MLFIFIYIYTLYTQSATYGTDHIDELRTLRFLLNSPAKIVIIINIQRVFVIGPTLSMTV